jgi:hypothetical protein
MAKKNFLVDIDLNNNQLLNATLQNLATAPSTAGKTAGFVYFNTTTKSTYVYTGLASPNDWLDLGQTYVHPTIGALNPTLTGANVLATLVTNSDGHVTSVSTRALTTTDIGAAPTVHNHTLSNITDVTATAAELNLMDLAGLTAGWVLRATGASTASWGILSGSSISNNLGWVSLNDGAINTTQTWSSSKINTELTTINNLIVGGVINKGGYDANTNTPALDASIIGGIKNGWAYTITASGSFFTENVQIGDMIIAKQDSPTALAHWTIVNKNIPDIVDADLSNKGIIQLASAAEVIAGIEATKAVTSATLAGKVTSQSVSGLVRMATDVEVSGGSSTSIAISPSTLKNYLATQAIGVYSQTIGNGALTTFTITHNLGTTDVSVSIYEVSTGDSVEMQSKRTSINVVTLDCNVAPTTNQYKVLIQK